MTSPPRPLRGLGAGPGLSAMRYMRFRFEGMALVYDVWFEFCYSDANVADWPSRGLVGFAADLRARAVHPVVLPPSESWGSVEAALGFAGEVPEPPPKRARR